MSWSDFRNQLREPPPTRYQNMQPSFSRILLFIPVFLIVFPLGLIFGSQYYSFFQEKGLTFFINPFFYALFFITLMLVIRPFEINYIWKKRGKGSLLSRYAVFEAPITEMLFMGTIFALWKGKEIEPIVSGAVEVLKNLF